MFGYVVINKPELKIKDYDKYQEYYCGLCQSLKQNHGRRGQLTLNYDLNILFIKRVYVLINIWIMSVI